ncbi:uncharacterized protein LOC108198886 isoform X1 [Daucus carota subsp. sativus]|uniref:uncharacterized protein LOC108198886 isoform X1 n=3 Tax=Daucus carota subsp. sativus TaxID=79200 RepID=UPI0007EF3B00|nr:PREDICTED: uncharacterized protein LOC108198886 isoform X1 [Daucus carota subsp. sativus]
MEAEKRRVPSQVVELADVNVLLVGHEGAGTSTFFNNFLKLGKKDKSSQSMHMTQTIRYFETKTMRGYISEHLSWYHHVPDLMSWGSGAGIAILVISGAENDPLSDEEKLKQIVQRVYLIRFLGIPKIVIVINKMDDPTYSLTRFMELKKSVVDVLKRAGYDYKNDTMSVPISGKSGLNIQTMTRHLRYSGKCLFETLATIDVSQLAMRVTSDQTWSPKEVEELGLFEELFKIDTSIDKDQTDQSKATLWYRRAKIAGKLQLFNAFQDADKAVECNLDLSNNPEYGEEVNDPFLYKIKGDLHYSRQSFDLARENYLHAYEIFNKQRWKKAVEKLQELICTSELLQSEEEEKLKTQTKKKGKNKGEKKEELLEENEELKEEKKEEHFDEKKDDELKEEKKKEEIGEKKDDDSILKISIVTDFSLDAKPQDGVYSGYKIRADISLPISIIRCSDYQKQNYQKLLSLGDIGPHVLSIHDMYDFTIEEESSTFFVVQPIKSVDYYYFLKFEDFRNRVKIDEGDKESILTKWWLFIQPEFQKKIRDIVYGLIFLFLKRQKCKSSMYVMNDADGKVLPSMDPNASDGDYLDDLVKKMKSIVKQPHLGHKSASKWLPIDLVHLFNSFSKECCMF